MKGSRQSLYMPYIIGRESPIPYLFEKMIPYFKPHYDIVVHSIDGNQFNSNGIREIKTKTNERYSLHKIMKIGIASTQNHDLIHTGAGGRIHHLASQLATLRNSNVAHVHTFRVEIDPNRWDPKIRQATAARADVVTAVSEHTAKTAEREFGISPEVIYNGVDVSLFSPEKGSSPIFKRHGIDDLVFMYVGSLEKRKRPLDFVEVAPNVPKASFVMVGDGPMFKSVHSKAKGIDNLHLLGRVNKSKLPEMYADATALVFPTVMEGCPNVVLEAMSSGTPVIGYDATSMPELIDDGHTGRLVEQGNVDLLTSAVTEMAKPSTEQMGDNAREYILENHRFEIIANRYLDIYKEALMS